VEIRLGASMTVTPAGLMPCVNHEHDFSATIVQCGFGAPASIMNLIPDHTSREITPPPLLPPKLVSLPEDVVLAILLHLDVTSLLRLSIVRNPIFATDNHSLILLLNTFY